MSVGRMSFTCQRCCSICIQQQNSNSQKKGTTSHICIYTQTASGEICTASCNWWSSKQNGQLLLSILSTRTADPGPLLGTLLWPVWTWLVMLIHITRWIHNSFVFIGILHTLFFYQIYCFAHMKKAHFRFLQKYEFRPLLQPLYIETHPVSTLTWESSELAPQVVLIGVWFLFIIIQTGFL